MEVGVFGDRDTQLLHENKLSDAREAFGEALYAMGLKNVSPNRGLLSWRRWDAGSRTMCRAESCFQYGEKGCRSTVGGTPVCREHCDLECSSVQQR